MIYALTHGFRTCEPNPTHTEHGLVQLSYMEDLMFALDCFWDHVNIKLIVVGDGDRFKEIKEMIKPRFPYVDVIVDLLLGGREAVAGGDVTTEAGDLIPREKVRTLSEHKGVRRFAWQVVKQYCGDKPMGDKIFCTGKQFMLALGFNDFKIASVYKLDPYQKSIECMMEMRQLLVVPKIYYIK